MLKKIRGMMGTSAGTGDGGPERGTINRVIVGIIVFGITALLGLIAGGIVEQATGRPLSDVLSTQLGSIVSMAVGALSAMLTRTSTPGSDPPQPVEVVNTQNDPVNTAEAPAAVPAARPPVQAQGQNRGAGRPGALPATQGDSGANPPVPPPPAGRVFSSEADAGEIEY